MLEHCVQELGESEWVWAHSPSSRAHVPLRVSPLVCSFLARVIGRCPRLEVAVFDRQEITELSAMFVFPGADPQPIHIAHGEQDRYHYSFFVNLAATERGAGAFEIAREGLSALRDGDDGLEVDHITEADLEVAELPGGSVMAFNAQCPHRGGGNASFDRLRPAVYFSVGDPGIYGVTYALKMRSRYLRVGHFRPFRAASTPHLLRDLRITRHLEHDRSFLVLDRGAHVYTIEAEQGHVYDLLVHLGQVQLGRAARATVAQIAQRLGASLDDVTRALDQFLEMGIVLNEGPEGRAPARWPDQYRDP